MIHMRLLTLLLSCCLCLPAWGADEEPPREAVWVLQLDGAVGPATSDYLVRGIEKAELASARLVVIRMNTPGGLDGAMRDIIEAILASSTPVATFVGPSGARAASAGTYILYASHVAAMAPATHLGAATPVSLGSPGSAPANPGGEEEGEAGPAPATAMDKKMVNDAAAYIRGLANLRGRNAEWAESAVRDAASLSAQEALDNNVIDMLATSVAGLVDQLQGREISIGDGTRVLDLEGAPLFEAAPDWRTRFLATITNPSLVLILGMIGFYGIILEFYNPGALVPGTVGVICLILAGYALQLLPVNYAGLALIIVGLGLMVAEAFSPSFGILGAGGLVAFVMGGVILFDSDLEAFRVGWPVLLAVGAVTAGFIIITLTLALRMRRQKVTTGIESMIGHKGIALEDITSRGQVRVDGEIWRATVRRSVRRGETVRVTGVDGLTLTVTREKR